MLVIRLHLGEEGVERVISLADGGVARHHPVRLDPVLQAVELPACIANLDASLTHVDGDALTLRGVGVLEIRVINFIIY